MVASLGSVVRYVDCTRILIYSLGKAFALVFESDVYSEIRHLLSLVRLGPWERMEWFVNERGIWDLL